MKKLRNTIACGVAALALLATGLTSCTGDFDNINTSKDKPTPEDVDRDNAWAAFIQTMQRNVFAEGANAYQLADNLLGDSYAGYFGQAQDWDSGSNSTCYAFPTAKWKDEPYKQAYNNVMSSWNILRQKVDSASVVFALGEVVKVQAMHRVTDIYGPLPYTAFGKMSSGLPYDSQETVYRTFIKELDHALKTLKAAYEADSGAKPIADFDVVFDSDLEKWIRFANSLKLRLAMRARFAAPGDAQTWAEEAVNFQFGAYNIGVMTDNTHSAQLLTRTGIGFSYKHPLEYLWGEYNECRMGATMESYLSGYGDPRLESYFSPAEKDGLPRNPQRHHLQPQGLPVAGQLSQSGLHLAADMDVRRRSLLPAGRGCTPRLEHGRHGRKPLQRRYPHVVLPMGRAKCRQISVRQQKHSDEISRLGAGRLDRESEQRHRQVGRRRP